MTFPYRLRYRRTVQALEHRRCNVLYYTALRWYGYRSINKVEKIN